MVDRIDVAIVILYLQRVSHVRVRTLSCNHLVQSGFKVLNFVHQ